MELAELEKRYYVSIEIKGNPDLPIWGGNLDFIERNEVKED